MPKNFLFAEKTMPWTKENPPRSMKNFPPEQKAKGANIANALLREKKMDEGKAIRIATAQAKKSAAKKK